MTTEEIEAELERLGQRWDEIGQDPNNPSEWNRPPQPLGTGAGVEPPQPLTRPEGAFPF
jgi:hypothetical protein